MPKVTRSRKQRKTALASQVEQEFIAPRFAGGEATASNQDRSRAYLERTVTGGAVLSRYPNIRSNPRPFATSADNNYIDARDAIKDCVDAYWAFPMLRNTIEVMVELANSQLYLSGGNQAGRDFVGAWWKKINGPTLAGEFFREWWRSGNSIVFRQDGKFTDADLAKMKQVFGAAQKEIPIAYIVLNPEMITAGGDITFGKPVYYKVLTPYEIKRLKEAATDAEKSFVRSVGTEVIVGLDENKNYILLDPTKLSVALYKAQSYEPFGIPMAYGVLSDIEAKLELKRIDLSVARTTDRAMLHIRVGETPSEHNRTPVNPATIKSLEALFAQESIARTLITDWTVNSEWLIPDVNKILGSGKYEQLDKDIAAGLNAFLFSEGEKFANTSIKVEVFVQRLKEARQAFINNFLQPEITRVCKSLGMRNFPTAHFEEISLKDELQYSKLVMSMFQLGALTPEEMIEAMGTGKMPTPEESLEAQRRFKEQRGEGLYMPIVGGSTQLQAEQLKLQDKQVEYQYEVQTKQAETQRQAANNKVAAKNSVAGKPVAKKAPGAAGRPSGSKAPQTTKKTSPVGTSRASEGWSLKLLQDSFYAVSNLQNAVDKKLRRQFKIKELDEKQAEASKSVVAAIISNEPQDKWMDVVAEYTQNPKEIQEAIAHELDTLSIQHNIDTYTAAILRLTRRDAP